MIDPNEIYTPVLKINSWVFAGLVQEIKKSPTIDMMGNLLTFYWGNDEVIKAKSRDKEYVVAENTGMVFVWFHETEVEPTWQLPDFSENGAYQSYKRRYYKGKFLPHEVFDNAFDYSHLQIIHHFQKPKLRTKTIFNEYDCHVAVDIAGFENQPFPFELNLSVHGMCAIVIRSKVKMLGMEFNTKTLVLPVMIEGETHMNVVSMDPQVARPLPRLVAYLFSFYELYSLKEDEIIWKHKTIWKDPDLLSSEGDLKRGMEWTRKFYAAA